MFVLALNIFWEHQVVMIKTARRILDSHIKARLWTLLLLSFSVFSSAANASFNFDLDSDGFGASNSQFLPVDEAFIFDVQVTSKGLRTSWKITEGYYLYQSKIEVSLLDSNATLGTPNFSDSGIEENDPYFGMTRVVYNELQMELPVTLISDAKETEIKITYQGCAVAGLCYPPQAKTVLYFPVENAPAPVLEDIEAQIKAKSLSLSTDDASSIFSFMQENSALATAAIFFLLGLGLTFTPCVLPMIPIITTIVAGNNQSSQKNWGRNFSLALSYVAGMALTYAAFGLTVGLLGASANLQATMQSPIVLIFFAIVFIALAAAMFGLYELQLPAFLRDRLQNQSAKLSGGKIASVFFIGALSALLVSPCVSAPLAGALIYISTSNDAGLGFVSLFSLGLGMGVPLIIVAVGGARFIPKAGAWMNYSKFIFGMLLLGVAVWLINRLVPGNIGLALWGVLSVGAAIYVFTQRTHKIHTRAIKYTLGSLLLLIGALWLFGAIKGSNDPMRPLTSAVLSESKLPFIKVYSLKDLQNELENAKLAGKPAFVDIYADWCISCIIMERDVFPQQDIADKLGQYYLIKADMTKNDAGNIALMEKYEIFGPPSYLFFDTNQNEMKQLRVVGEIGKKRFQERLNRALGNSE
ncbi:hypothetical protein A3738_06130 [Oleiphilus sp. HI0066]|nr:hypothetical protein A3738_06130 [Oleiphilus sp. HI0066]